jgi:hypothetical protein
MQVNRIYLLPKRISCSAVNNAIKYLATKVSFTDIRQLIQVKNHTVANFVTNLLHSAAIWHSTCKNIMLNKLAKTPTVYLN